MAHETGTLNQSLSGKQVSKIIIFAFVLLLSPFILSRLKPTFSKITSFSQNKQGLIIGSQYEVGVAQIDLTENWSQLIKIHPATARGYIELSGVAEAEILEIGWAKPRIIYGAGNNLGRLRAFRIRSVSGRGIAIITTEPLY